MSGAFWCGAVFGGIVVPVLVFAMWLLVGALPRKPEPGDHVSRPWFEPSERPADFSEAASAEVRQ